MIDGQFPRVTWRANPEAQARTIEEAVEIARSCSVQLPDDVAFFVDEFGELGPTITARCPRVWKPVGGRFTWSDLVNQKTGKVPVLIRPDILRSDEAIVAVIAHEIHELRGFRSLVGEHGSISFEEFIANHAWDNPGNLHDEAWDVADALVLRMRGEEL
jgi:hypothetical protein